MNDSEIVEVGQIWHERTGRKRKARIEHVAQWGFSGPPLVNLTVLSCADGQTFRTETTINLSTLFSGWRNSAVPRLARLRLKIVAADGAKIEGVRDMDDDRGLAVYLLWRGASHPTLKKAQEAYIKVCRLLRGHDAR